MENDNFTATKDSRSFKGLASGTIFIDTRRKVKDKSRPKAETYPVKIRITYKGNRAYYSTGAKVTKEEWPLLDSHPNKTWKTIKETYDDIEKYISELDGFSFDGLGILMGRGDKGDVYGQFDAEIKKMRKAGRISTAISFECTKKSIENFAGQELKFNAINKTWLEHYQDYMENTAKNKVSTRSIYLRALRSLINKSGNPDPFAGGKFEIKQGTGRIIALSRVEMDRLLAYPVVDGSVTHKMRDLFEFSYRCNGINPKDIINLTWKENLINHKYIVWIRAKTARKNAKERIIKAKVSDRMQSIINRWGVNESPYIFGYLDNDMKPDKKYMVCQNLVSLMNTHLNIITKAIGMQHITSYTARHSYANIMKNDVPLSYLSQSLGHATFNQTMTYTNRLDDEDIDKFSKILD